MFLFLNPIKCVLRKLKLIPYREPFRCKTSGPVLYFDDISPPARFVLMTASHLNVNLKLHKIDLFQNENRTKEYEKINPLFKIPSLTVDKESIIDSHAICLYLCHKNNDFRLYPKDPLLRAKVVELLFYNSSTLFPLDSAIFSDYFAGKKEIDKDRLRFWDAAMNYLDNRLKQHEWLSGNTMTLSDICCAATITSLQLLIPADEKHKNINKWLQQIKQEPFYEINDIGLKRLQMFVNLLK